MPGITSFIESSYLIADVDQRGQRLVLNRWDGDEQMLHWGTIPGL